MAKPIRYHKNLANVLVKEKAVLILGRLYHEDIVTIKELLEETNYDRSPLEVRLLELIDVGLVELDPEFKYKVYKLTPLGAGLVKQYLFDFYMLIRRLRRMLNLPR